MSNNFLTPYKLDDGFSYASDSPPTMERICKWSLEAGYTDLAGALLQGSFVCVAVDEENQRWDDNRVTRITRATGPLFDVDAENAKIPRDTWALDKQGNPRPPWTRMFIVRLISLTDGIPYKFESGTIGGRVAVGELKDRVIAMRNLRGEKVVAVVELSTKPMPTKYGMRKRPFFDITDWKLLASEAAPPAALESEPAPAPASATDTFMLPKQPGSSRRKDKRSETNLSKMGDVAPLSGKEIAQDDIPW